MSYRILISLKDHGATHDFVIRGDDFGDMFAKKDAFLKAVVRCSGARVLTAPGIWIEGAVRSGHFVVTGIEAKWFCTPESREDWIKVYADRHYEMDVWTGMVKSPQWSLDMDRYKPQIEALKRA